MKPIVDSLKVLGESTKMLESLRDHLFKPKELKFNSQICTTKEQSEKLIALGLKKETADMHWYRPSQFEHDYWFEGIGQGWSANDLPAWSLHRLIELMPDTITVENATCMGHRFFYLLTFTWYFVTYEVSGFVFKEFAEYDNYYDNIIDCIEWLIKEGYFNKEYLV